MIWLKKTQGYKENGRLKNYGEFTIKSHQTVNLDIQESTKKYQTIFSRINQQYEPLIIENLPIEVQMNLNKTVNSCNLPTIEPNEMLQENQISCVLRVASNNNKPSM